MDTEEPSFDSGPLIDARLLVGLLADEERLRVCAALILGARGVDEIKSATGLSTRSIGRALARLTDAGLVIRDDDGNNWLLVDAFRQAAIAAAPDDKPTSFNASDDASRVLRVFIRGGRLVSIPAVHSKRLIVLDYLVQDFEPGRRYTERQVNAVLARWHEDVASLRRYLVDEEFLQREQGGAAYWRAGGSFDIE